MGLIWFHPDLNAILEEHGRQQEVSCDATFRLVPHMFGPNKQHWTVFLLVGENFLPAVQVKFAKKIFIIVDISIFFLFLSYI